MESKIGLCIYQTNEGFKNLLAINDDGIWTKNVRDIREDLKNIDHLSSVLMITITETGTIIIIASPIEGRITDYISAWIYVPNGISTSGKDLERIVNETKNEIVASKRNDEKLKERFNQSYKITPTFGGVINKSQYDKYAYRYYGPESGQYNYQLFELLGDLYQSYYSKYKYVFLFDKASNRQNFSGDDLTDIKLSTFISVTNPEPKDGFSPYIHDKPFDTPMLIEEGSNITVLWQKNGYYRITKPQLIVRNTDIIVPSSDEYYIVFPKKNIVVKDERGQPLDVNSYSVLINRDQPLQDGNFKVKENQIDKSKITIEAEGYDYYEENMSLRRYNEVRLQKTKSQYTFILPSRYDCSFTIKTEHHISHSPIRGYKIKGNEICDCKDNELVYKRINSYSLILMISTLILGLIIGSLVICYYKNQQITTLNEKLSHIEAQNAQPSEAKRTNNQPNEKSSNWQDVVSYLDNNPIWEKEEMDKYELIKGLWDAINKHNYTFVLKYENKLIGSTQFKIILQALEQNKQKKLTDYCKGSDTEITVEKYIEKMNNITNLEQKTKKKDKEPIKDSGKNDQDKNRP